MSRQDALRNSFWAVKDVLQFTIHAMRRPKRAREIASLVRNTRRDLILQAASADFASPESLERFQDAQTRFNRASSLRLKFIAGHRS